MATISITNINKNPFDISSQYVKNTKRLFNALFQWDNLPKGLKSLHIEQFLFDYGTVAVFKLVEGKETLYVLPATRQQWDIYGDMTDAYVYSPFQGTGGMVSYSEGQEGNLGAFKTYNITNTDVNKNSKDVWFKGAFIKNNLDSLPTLYGSYSTLEKLDAIWGQLVRDNYNTRNTRIIRADNTEKATVIRKEIDRLNASNNLYEIVNLGIAGDLQDIKVFDSVSKQKDYWEDFKQTEQLFRKNLGIPYDSRPEKKERVLEAEINASQLENALLLNDMLEMRLEAVKTINKTFGTKISVKLTKEVEGLISSYDQTMISKEKENRKENENEIK